MEEDFEGVWGMEEMRVKKGLNAGGGGVVVVVESLGMAVLVVVVVAAAATLEDSGELDRLILLLDNMTHPEDTRNL